MGLNFRLKDFAYPFAIIRKKKQFDIQQYQSPEALKEYQLSQIKKIIAHAYKHIPYYRKLFDSNDFNPFKICELSEFSKVPFLTKDKLLHSFSDLTADNVHLYKPMELCTSGTTGGQVKILVDKPSNIIEFVYYWRFWGWHGYRLGDRFAEFSAENFTPIEKNTDTIFEYKPIINRLIVNSLLLSKKCIREYIALFQKYKPLFLKGLPSNLYIFALLCNEVKKHGIKFKAMFSQGENLHFQQKKLIEEVFDSPVYDSYGHLERTVAISQCQYGSYHIHADYGFVEFVKPPDNFEFTLPLISGQSVYEIVSTSLHNMSMPLIRYKTGDLVIIDSAQTKCLCNRSFPLVHSIVGRDTDIVITPDKRAITALYVALDRLTGITYGQIVQETIDKLIVRIVCDQNEQETLRNAIIQTIHSFTGPVMNVIVKKCELNELYEVSGKKFKSIVSKIDLSTIIG